MKSALLRVRSARGRIPLLELLAGLGLVFGDCAASALPAGRTDPATVAREAGTAAPLRLERKRPVDLELAPGERREVEVPLSAGDYFLVSLTPSGFKATGRLIDPQGEPAGELNGPGGPGALEILAQIASHTGVYRLEIHRPEDPSSPGASPCTAELEERRGSSAADVARVQAEMAFARARQLKGLDAGAEAEQALSLLDQARTLWISIGDAEGEVRALHLRGRTLRRPLQRRDEAIEAFRGAVEIADRSLVPRIESDDAIADLCASLWQNFALTLFETGDSARAGALYERALPVWRALAARDASHYDGSLVDTLLSLGDARIQADPERATALFQESLDVAHRAGLDVRVVKALIGLGRSSYRAAHADRATAYLKQAHDAASGNAALDPALDRQALYEICALQNALGELQEALETCKGVLRDIPSAAGYERANTLAALGAIYHDLGELDLAADDYQQARDLFHGTAPDRYADAVRNLGVVQLKAGNVAEAVGNFELSSQVAPEEDTLDRGLALLYLGRASLDDGKPNEALDRLGRGLDLVRQAHDQVAEADLLLEVGTALGKLKRIEEAEAAFDRSLEIAARFEDDLRNAAIFSRRAEVRRDGGKLTGAVGDIEKAIQVVEGLRSEVASQGLKTSLLADRRSYYELQVDLLMRQAQAQPGAGFTESAFAANEAARSRALLDLLAEGRIGVAAGLSPDLDRKRDDLDRRLSAAQRDLLAARAQRDELRIRELRRGLRALEQEAEQLDEQVRRENPRYADVASPRPLGADEIRRQLGADEALLEYLLGKDASYLFLVTRDGLQAFPLPPREEIARKVQKLRNAISERNRGFTGQAAAAANALYRCLLAPAASAIKDRTHLVIAPDAELYTIPFEVFLEDSAPRPPEQLPYLVKRFAISYVPSGSVLARLEAPRKRGDGLEFVAFADPVYAPASGLELLPKTRLEVEEIAKLYPGRSRLLLGAEASEASLASHRQEIEGARLLHFATHGFLTDDSSGGAGLRLASDPASGADGLLLGREILALHLSADLVVLSACETGRGRQVAGEGILGLPRALLYAGAPSVVVSLWSAADDSTKDLMIELYRELGRTGDKAEALRRAKLGLLRKRPFYWAPFILVGRAR